MQNLIINKLVNSVHDISSGGILVALTEMCISGKIGAKIKIPQNKINLHEYLFSEDQSRYLLEVSGENKEKVSKILKKNSVYFEIIGKTQKDILEIDKNFKEKITKLEELNTFWFENYFKGN